MFDIAFARLGIIPKTRNKFVETVAVAERYLIITHVKYKESKKQPMRIYLPVKLADGRISIRKEETSSDLVYNTASLGKMAPKQSLFHEDKLNMKL